MRARFAVCDFRVHGDIDVALNQWRCRYYSCEVRWLHDNAVLPPVAHPHTGLPAVYELQWYAPDADSLDDGATAEPRTLTDLDTLLAALPGPLPLLQLPTFNYVDHINMMIELLVETAALQTFNDDHRVKMKLLAAFIYRAL